jgi:hypothetical protein
MVQRGDSSTTVRKFQWPARAATGSCNWRRTQGMRGGRWRRATMVGCGSSLKGAVGGFTPGGIGMPPAVGRG